MPRWRAQEMSTTSALARFGPAGAARYRRQAADNNRHLHRRNRGIAGVGVRPARRRQPAASVARPCADGDAAFAGHRCGALSTAADDLAVSALRRLGRCRCRTLRAGTERGLLDRGPSRHGCASTGPRAPAPARSRPVRQRLPGSRPCRAGGTGAARPRQRARLFGGGRSLLAMLAGIAIVVAAIGAGPAPGARHRFHARRQPRAAGRAVACLLPGIAGGLIAGMIDLAPALHILQATLDWRALAGAALAVASCAVGDRVRRRRRRRAWRARAR